MGFAIPGSVRVWLFLGFATVVMGIATADLQGEARAAPSATLRGGLKVSVARARSLSSWKSAIQEYSRRHYGEDTWRLEPACIVLHYTAGRTFPWNLVRSKSFAGEKPGLASHYVIHGSSVWQILPPTVRSRGAFGINHRAINIEMVAANAADLATRKPTLLTCARLTKALMDTYAIPLAKVYSHTAVGHMDRNVVPEVLDRVNPQPYQKPDPGESNMRTIKRLIAELP